MLKVGIFAVLCALATVVYFGSLHVAWFPAMVVPLTFVDNAIPTWPPAVVLYGSFYLLLLVPLVVIPRSADLWRTAFGFAWIVLGSGVTFVFWPTQVGAFSTDPWIRTVLAPDRAGNALPSLHASLSLFCTLVAARWMKRTAGLWVWTILVMVSPLFIGQHVALDLVAGAALGAAIYRILFRPEAREAPDTEPVLETLRIRQRLAKEIGGEYPDLIAWRPGRRVVEIGFFVGLAAIGVWLGGWPGVLIAATALNSFPLLVHEGMHGILFADRRVNWAVSVALGAAFLMSFTAYRVMHTRHHHYLGDPRDPDDYHNYTRVPGLVWLLHFVRLTVGPLLYLALIPILALKHGRDGERRLILAEYLILFTAYSVLLRVVPVAQLFAAWIAPLLLVGVFTAIRGFTQHGITDAADPYLASRTMMPNRLIAFFLLNENYHLEHHLFPEVPSHHLRRLHELIWPKLPRAVAGRSYLAFLAKFLAATPRLDETPIGLVNPAGPRA